MSLLSTQPYKGTRDFFPEQMRSRDWMFASLQTSVEKFGYEKYDAPLIEPLDIYLAKTSEEIVSQQIYSFEDRGGRKVAIRPEMTPTVSRMVAARSRELPKPVRWYSLPNLWRYERPGKGRLREHWQLNCDLFAAQDEFSADVEILSMAMQILMDFGANENDFHVSLNHRQLLNAVFSGVLKLPQEKWAAVARIMDKKEKINREDYVGMLQAQQLTQEKIALLDNYLEQKKDFLKTHETVLADQGASYLLKLLETLEYLGYKNFIDYEPSVVRGFDYYTGMVFEIFDKHPENRRSLFGGGRYNNLVGAFSKDALNAVGFGLGDVTLEEFLRSHNLYKNFPCATKIFVATFEQEHLRNQAMALATLLRKEGLQTETALSTAKLGNQFKTANAKKIPWVIVCGEEEFQKKTVAVKNLDTGEQQEIIQENLINFFKEMFGEGGIFRQPRKMS